MPTSKRTIKLREAQARTYGREFLRVSSQKQNQISVTITIDPHWFEENVNWIFQNANQFYTQKGQYGLSSLEQLTNQQADFWLQQVTWEDFTQFLFEHTIFENNFDWSNN